MAFFLKWPISHFIFIFQKQSGCCKLNILRTGEISKWIFQARWVQSNIQTSIYHQHLISLKNPHELRWILIMMEAHTENLCEVKKKRCLRGTSNSHNPQLTWTSAQSEETLKVRGDASTYINHERSHHKEKKNKTPAPISITQSCVSISFCASVTFFSLGFFSFLSYFMIHLFCLHVLLSVAIPVKMDLRAFVHNHFDLFWGLFFHHLSVFVLH